jgi:hypothetical protein
LVPLLLYVLPMPRRRVMSTALYLWERFLKSEILGRTSERFRRALGLALLAAILAALIAAAAELSIGKPAVDAGRLVVLLDASASMNAASDGVSNLDRAKRAAAELIDSLDATTKVAVAEASGELRLVVPFQPAGRGAVEAVSAISPFDGPTELGRALRQAYDLWGADAEIYVFTDMPLPESQWSEPMHVLALPSWPFRWRSTISEVDRAHVWIAPPAGDNVAITALTAERRGKKVLVRYTLANYGRGPQTLAGTVLANDSPRSAFQAITLGAGQTIEQQAILDEPGAATLKIRLDIAPDALPVDNEACIRVPGLEDLRASVVWPPGGKHNAYVSAVLSSLEEQGTIGRIANGGNGDSRLTVFVNHSPGEWPEGGAIVLHPLRAGVMGVSGLHAEPVTITRQAQHPLLDGVELRGLIVKEVVHVEPPSWAQPIVWAGDVPLVWAGEYGKTKALIVAMPLTTDGSRLPLLASFPVLMRNACLWILPQPKVLRPGETIDGWTSRRAGLSENPQDGQKYAFGTLSASESDLRREPAAEEAPIAKRQPLAMALVGLAIVLLTVEWGLFHRRFTE